MSTGRAKKVLIDTAHEFTRGTKDVTYLCAAALDYANEKQRNAIASKKWRRKREEKLSK